MAYENWELLAHELCGHARLYARGTHPRESPNREIRHGHETVVPMANAIRAEKGLGARQHGDTADDPYCGESFKRDKGAADFEDTNARHLGACRHLREIYLWKLQNARNQMTPEERAKLPKLKKAKDYDISERLPER